MEKIRVGVIGDGGWGSTLGLLAADRYAVQVWGPDADFIQQIQTTGENTKFLPGIQFPSSMQWSADLNDVVKQADLIVYVIPSRFTDAMIQRLKDLKVDFQNKIFVSATKGFDHASRSLLTKLFAQELSIEDCAVISGPTIAFEVARGIPSAAVVAAENPDKAQQIQKVFSCDSFRLYTNDDVLGVQLGGALKNVIALACGICDGLGFGANTKSALLTRGLSEIIRLGQAMGAQAQTFAGLSGLGDLATTCFSLQSRNRSVGEKIGSGQKCQDIIAGMDMVAEGVETVKCVVELAAEYKINMPIHQEVFNIIYNEKVPADAVKDLLSRDLTAE